jgi:sugar phosphate isomerase/epimerase
MITERKIGLFSWYGFNTKIKNRLNKIKKYGFDATMLWWGDDKAFNELNKEELINETINSGLIIENIHVPFDSANDIWSNDSITRNNLILKYTEWINDCANYHIPIMVMHISKGNDISEPNGHGLRSLEILVDKAERLNIRIALENTRKNNLLEYLIENVKSDNLGICYDTSHAQLYGDKDFDLMTKYKDKIFCFHISDNDGIEDKHWNIGKGIINWNRFVNKFPLDYDGIISLEVCPQNSNECEDQFLEEAYKSIESIRRQVNDRSMEQIT